jgi:hypothetical protein
VHMGAPGIACDKSGSKSDTPGSADNKSDSAGIAGSIQECQQQSSLGITTSSLGTLMVRLEIIATTYHSTIFETHVFHLYSHLCIYITTHLDISNYFSIRQKHPGVPDGSDGSDGTSYSLTENYTLLVAQEMGRRASVLHYFVVMFTHDQMDTCVTLFEKAVVMLKPITQRLAMLNHIYYLLFNDFQNLCIQFVFLPMYLYINTVTCYFSTGWRQCLRAS